jgi:triphosphoribosyl-dephospho-CoA synthase
MKAHEIANYVASCAQLAALLEVSAWPKPGNVHRTADLPGTRYEHFLASIAATGPVFRKAGLKGAKVGLASIKPSEIGVGALVEEAVALMLGWQKGGNVQLGILMLFMPASAAAGKTIAEMGRVEVEALRENVDLIVKSTTPVDASNVYNAIAMASSPDEMGLSLASKLPSVFDREAKETLLSEGISLYDCLKASSSWDLVARELASSMEISFEVGYPTFAKVFRETKDVNVATVHTFLTLLSCYGDTFMARKVGLKEAKFVEDAVRVGLKKVSWVSREAGEVLRLGGLLSETGKRRLMELDEKLRRTKGELNPGSTADLTASSILIATLSGLRY